MERRSDSTAEKIEQSFLTCPVCFEVYRQPKCLPCLHTFCSHCLLSYIESMAMYGVRGEKGFPCPVCKQKVRILDYYKPFDDWLDEIQNNFFIQNMIDCLADQKAPQADTDNDVQNAPKNSTTPEIRQKPSPYDALQVPVASSRLPSAPPAEGQSGMTSRPPTMSSSAVAPTPVSLVPNIIISSTPEIRQTPPPYDTLQLPVASSRLPSTPPAEGQSGMTSRPPTMSSSAVAPTPVPLVPNIIISSSSSTRFGQLLSYIKPLSLKVPSTLPKNRSSSASELHTEEDFGGARAGGDRAAVAAATTSSDTPMLEDGVTSSSSRVNYRDTNNFQKVYEMTANNWNDYMPSMLSDVICLPKHNDIIVLDYNNRCVKYVKNVFVGRNVTTAMEVNGRPCSVSLLDKDNENVIIVSLLDRDELNIISVPDLELIDVIDTERSYRGLTVLSPTAILAGSPYSHKAPSRIDLIRINHRYEVISTTTIFQSGNWKRGWNFDVYLPHYITALSETRFAVSDAERNCLILFEIHETYSSTKAVKQFTLHPSRYQQFLAVGGLRCEYGCIYFVDKEAHEVHRVVPGGTVKCETILKQRDGIWKPASVCVGPRGEICVADWNGKVSIFKPRYHRLSDR